MKKTVSMLLALSMVFAFAFCISGCQNQTASSTASTSSTEKTSSTAVSSAEELKPVTLVYWIMGNGEQKDSQKVWAQFNAQLAEKLPNTTVEFVNIIGSEYKDKWLKACAAQDKIDLAWAGYTHMLADDVSKGALMPLEDLMSTYGKNVQSYFGDTALNLHKSADGKLYFIPAWQGLVGGRNGFFFPTELVKVAGGDTWAQKLQQESFDTYNTFTAESHKPVYELLEQYFEANKQNGTLALGYNPNAGFGRYFNGGKIGTGYAYAAKNDKTLTVQNNFASDAIKYHYQKMAEWYEKGYIRADIDSCELKETSYASDGLDGYIFWMHNAFEDNSAEIRSADAGMDITCIFAQPNCVFSTGFATGTVIPATAANPERAMMLLDLLYTEDGKDIYQTYVYGIEGTNYTKNTDGTITLVTNENKESAYSNFNWTLGTCEYSLPTDASKVGQYQALKKVEDTAEVNPWLGFKFDATAVASEAAGIKTVVDEYQNSLNFGSLGDKWEARYNEFLSKLNDAKIDVYMAELQKQINAYATANNLK